MLPLSDFSGGINTATAGANSAVLFIDKLPGIEYQLLSFNLPSISGNVVSTGGPPQLALNATSPVRYEWGDLTVTCLLSESFDNYIAIYNWLWNNVFESQFSNIDGMGTIVIYNNHKQIIRTVTLFDIFPRALDELKFDMSSADPLTFSSTFHSEWFSIKDENGKELTYTIKGRL